MKIDRGLHADCVSFWLCPDRPHMISSGKHINHIKPFADDEKRVDDLGRE